MKRRREAVDELDRFEVVDEDEWWERLNGMLVQHLVLATDR